MPLCTACRCVRYVSAINKSPNSCNLPGKSNATYEWYTNERTKEALVLLPLLLGKPIDIDIDCTSNCLQTGDSYSPQISCILCTQWVHIARIRAVCQLGMGTGAKAGVGAAACKRHNKPSHGSTKVGNNRSRAAQPAPGQAQVNIHIAALGHDINMAGSTTVISISCHCIEFALCERRSMERGMATLSMLRCRIRAIPSKRCLYLASFSGSKLHDKS